MPATVFRERLGCAGIELDAYGGDFSAATNLNAPNEDGITVEYTAEYAKSKDGQTLGIREIDKIAHELAFECMLVEHRARNIALSMGFQTSKVTDNSGGAPQDENFEITGFESTTYLALRLKIPQPQDVTLFDYWTAYRVAVIAKFSQAIKIGAHRYIPVRFEATQDPNNSNKLGKVLFEYDDGDLP